jgi:hypothetical protein
MRIQLPHNTQRSSTIRDTPFSNFIAFTGHSARHRLQSRQFLESVSITHMVFLAVGYLFNLSVAIE